MSESASGLDDSWVDPDDAPEWTDEWFDKADLMWGDKVLRRGRPPGSAKPVASLCLGTAVFDRFRADGPGWQTRINEALRKAAGV